MTSLIHKAKGYYQFAKATVPEVWAKSLHPYREEEAFELARKSIGERLSYNSGRLNFIMAVPVVNWEVTLLQNARIHGTCHHLNIEARGFFESKLEWEKYRALNSAKLKLFFDSSYVEDDINILFLYVSEFHIDPDCILAFKLKNVIIVHFNWDDRLHYTSKHKGQSVGVKKVAKAADFNLTMAVGPMSRYVSDAASVFYWRGISASASIEAVLPHVEFNRILFFGSRYGYRAQLIDYLTRKELPIDVFGSGWGTDFISYENLLYKIPRYALNLGVSTIGYTQGLSCVKGRDFEVPVSGGLYLTNHSLEIEQVYNSGKEILTYKSMDDCYRQATKVLENPLAFADIRRRGVVKAQAFSWEARFNYLISLIQSLTPIKVRPYQ
jgi:spore maturation protein CgeB